MYIQLLNDGIKPYLNVNVDEIKQFVQHYFGLDKGWDIIIPFEPMWAELRRICKPNSPMIFTASQPFTSMLVMSNLKEFKVEWIWGKSSR